MDTDRLLEAVLPADLTTPGAARDLVRAVCRAWHDDGDLPAPDAEVAALVVSELVTNAVEHGTSASGRGAQVCLRLLRGAGPAGQGPSMRVEVGDRAPDGPAPRAARPGDEGGRGLALVAALARDWGWRSEPPGKVVWASLA